MKLYSQLIQEPPSGKRIWHPRWFFNLYRGPGHCERSILGGHVEFVLSKPTSEFGINLEVGTAASETPFDGYIKIAGTTIYWGIEQGRRLADLITQIWGNRLPNRLSRACLDDTCECPLWQPGATSKRHHGRNGEPYGERYEGRQLQVRTSDSRLWLQVWTRKNGWTRGQFAKWRSSTIKLNPMDMLLGERRYWYEDIDTRRIQVELPEAVYPVKATLQRVSHGRPRGRKALSWSVDVRADESKGIPNRHDHSDGWKGDRVWGFGVGLKQGHRPDWHIDAKAAIESRILKDRADTGFRAAQPLEAG